MIPRTVRQRLERTLVSYSRQSLPRHVRYSTPSKRVSAQALPSGSVPSPDYPSFLSSATKQNVQAGVNSPSSSTAAQTDVEGMHEFLKLRTPYTMIPTPAPLAEPSGRKRPTTPSHSIQDLYFTDTPTQDHLAIIDACLHDCYDVPRAQKVFDMLRDNRQPGDPVLEPRLYNSFLKAYLEMASRQAEKRVHWLEEMWALYDAMEGDSREKVPPTASTYALMLLAWNRYNPDSATPVPEVTMTPPNELLPNLLDRNINVSLVVSDRYIPDSKEAADIITILSRAAVELNVSGVVTELGSAQEIGMQASDPLEGVPDVNPVMKVKVRAPEFDEDGNPLPPPDTPPEMEVPFNLSTLRKHLANVAFARRVLPEDVAARQKLLEESVYDIATARLQHESNMLEEIGLGGEKTLRTTQLKRWMWQWHQKLEERLTNDIQELIKQEEIMTAKRSRKDERLGPFLSLLKPSKLSLITILELMHLSGSGGVNSGMKTARALLTVGKAVELEYKAEMCRRNDIQIPQASSTFASKSEIEKKQRGFFTGLGYRELHARRVAAARYVQEAEEWTSEWTQELKVRVGSFLVDTLMDVATVERTAINKVTGQEVTEEHPAFYHSYEYMKGHKLGIIRLNPVVAERMAKDNLRDTLHPRHLPMLVKPKPWLDHNQGGYIYNKTSAMRFKESREQEVYLAHASAQGHVELVYAGLDVLGSTPWVINRDVFDIVLQVWNSGERFAKIPPAAFDGPEPERPGEGETDPHKKTIYITRAKQYAQDKASNHSERCNVNYKIEIARAFLGDTFYLPHNLDFRGRAYPIPPHLNHIGDDLARGLLKFGESRPLGERGLRWLKIHLANLYGYDKASFDERVNWVHERMEQIYDSATKPLDGQRWWTHADDPWQCLATCKELHAALESPDPLAFESSLPVHQDGTCNGLQHYAALGGDSIGAAQVNLAVTDRPSDVYTYVANMVEREIEDDIKKPDNKWAKMLQGKIARKVVKQTVMTTVYGVTFIGARDQLEKQLKDRGDIPVEDCWHAASYLAKKTLDCIGDLFRGAKDIQNWLNLSARLISKSIPPDRLELAARTASKRRKGIPIKDIRKEQMTSVIWTTPLGLPIVQPYRQTQRRQILTSLQTVFISDPNMAETVNSTKQASAFPPNFVHSLDATHMMLTALECRSQGLTFASVHDSYWTHASTIDEMSGIIRDTFVALHSSDVLAKLREEFVERYKDFKVPVISLRTPQMLKKLGMSESALVAAARASRGVELDTTEDADKEPANDLGESNEAEAVSENRFINLVDLLPPLPKKGDFNVETIKKSLYFFS